MSIDTFTDPITDLYQRIAPYGSQGFSAKHLLHYIEKYIIIEQQSLQHTKARSLISLGKNVRDSLQLQAVSFYLFAILDKNGDGIVDKNDLLVCKKKFLFWLAPIHSVESIAPLEEYFTAGKNRFRHISLQCGSYHKITNKALESLFFDKLPVYIPSRKHISTIAAPILLHLLSTQSHLPLQDRVIHQKDWLANIGALYNSLFYNTEYVLESTFTKVSK